MKRKFLVFICFMLSFFCVFAEEIPNGDLIVMTEKVVITSGGHENPPKSPEATLMIYQSGNSFYFGEAFVGCAVTLLLNNVVVYSDFVGTDGTVTIPASFTGTFELCLTIGTQVFSAEIEL